MFIHGTWIRFRRDRPRCDKRVGGRVLGSYAGVVLFVLPPLGGIDLAS